MVENIEKANRHVIFLVIAVAIVIALLALWSFFSSFSRTLDIQPSTEEIPLEVELQ